MLLIRDAMPADAGAIAAIYNDAVRHTTAILMEGEVDAANRAQWMEARQGIGYPVLVAEAGGRVLGYAAFGDWRPFDGFRGTVENSVYVAPEARGQGVAQTALSLLESHCFSLLGLRQLYAYVPVGNVASRKLFTSAGYTECGILKDWIRVGTSYQDVCFFQKINEL